MSQEKRKAEETMIKSHRKRKEEKLTSPLWHGNGQIGFDHPFPSCGNRRRTRTVDIIPCCKRTSARGGSGSRGELLDEERRGLGCCGRRDGIWRGCRRHCFESFIGGRVGQGGRKVVRLRGGCGEISHCG